MTARPRIAVLELAPQASGFRDDVLRGLAAPRKAIPSKYFYDEAGSQLFERICTLDEYYLTRTELAIMRQDAAEMAEVLGPECLLVEYGSGSSSKTRLLLDRLAAPAGYVPIDISREHLRQSALKVAARYPQLPVLPVSADFTGSLRVPASRRSVRRRVVYFPGSTVGNFTPRQAAALLRKTAKLCGPDGGLLLGVDLKKDPARIHAAYNDAEGVTAAFNLNLLARINRELEGDFVPSRFWHHAFYHPAKGRIEMHLVSSGSQQVHVGPTPLSFDDGESIRTEYSYKYSLAELDQLATGSGFQVRRVWTDPERDFGVLYLRVV